MLREWKIAGQPRWSSQLVFYEARIRIFLKFCQQFISPTRHVRLLVSTSTHVTIVLVAVEQFEMLNIFLDD